MRVFSVYDSKAESYGMPFVQKTSGEALRGFATASNDPSLAIGKYPEDFTLFEIGVWDETRGIMTPHDAHVSLGKAIEYKTDLTPAPGPRPMVNGIDQEELRN